MVNMNEHLAWVIAKVAALGIAAWLLAQSAAEDLIAAGTDSIPVLAGAGSAWFVVVRVLRTDKSYRQHGQWADEQIDKLEERVEKRDATIRELRAERDQLRGDNDFMRRQNITFGERLRELGVDPAQVIAPPLKED